MLSCSKLLELIWLISWLKMPRKCQQLVLLLLSYRWAESPFGGLPPVPLLLPIYFTHMGGD